MAHGCLVLACATWWVASALAVGLAGDPRREERCASYYGRLVERPPRLLRQRGRGGRVSRHGWSGLVDEGVVVRSVEDYVSNRTFVDERFDARVLPAYGSVLPDGSYYVEVPKTGTWGFKASLARMSSDVSRAPVAARKNASFAFVREPLERFVSAYGTVLHRTKGLKFLADDKKDRFSRFVDKLLEFGADVHKEANFTKDVFHAMSQLFFLGLFPSYIDYLVHVDKLDYELALLSRVVQLPPPQVKRWNVHEGYRDVADRDRMVDAAFERDPNLASKLWVWLGHDYTCLGYAVPDRLRAAAEAPVRSRRRRTFGAGPSGDRSSVERGRARAGGAGLTSGVRSA